MRVIVRRHPVALYFALAFGISWGGVAVAALLFEPTLLILFMPIAAGPSVAALIVTGVVHGKDGYRSLFRRITVWRIGLRWYALLLASPMLIVAVLALLRLASPDFTPKLFISENPLTLLGISMAAGLLAGLFEEIGWTGVATPRMLERRGYFGAGLALGAVWATWHIGPELTGVTSWGDLLPLRILCWMYASMVPYRILMTRAYHRTGSGLLGVLLHASFTGGQFLLEPADVSQTQSLIWWSAFGAALWIAVAVMVFVDRRFDQRHRRFRRGAALR